MGALFGLCCPDRSNGRRLQFLLLFFGLFGRAFGTVHPVDQAVGHGQQDQGADHRGQRNATEDGFLAWIDKQIREHLNKESELTKSFVYLYGFGQIYPYLRTNNFLSKFERYNHGEDYKIIVFYPGHANRNSFSLFGCLKDDHTYRSINLINE